jgi:hypothetical protein
MYEMRYVRGHVEVFLHNQFQFSADTVSEARQMIEEEMSEAA